MITEEVQREALKSHFSHFYSILAKSKLIPNAIFENSDGVQRCLSGIPVPYHNAVFGCPKKTIWDKCIQEQVSYFRDAKMPFVWYFDKESDSEFKKELLDRGFQDCGVFRGVIGILDKSIPAPVVPQDCTIELVSNESAMNEFNDLVCATFGLQGSAKDLFQRALCNENMFHWLARKDGKAVSALTTCIEGDVVSFWNGASVPEIRRQGLSTALRRLALKDATAKGCRMGVSYLMAEGLALGICSKLGYETKWRFNVLLAPETH